MVQLAPLASQALLVTLVGLDQQDELELPEPEVLREERVPPDSVVLLEKRDPLGHLDLMVALVQQEPLALEELMGPRDRRDLLVLQA